MGVLTLSGKPYDWSRWNATDLVKWDRDSMYGQTVKGSLRTIAHLDRMSKAAEKRFGTPITVIQPPYNTTVAASAGTHDYDNCLDFYIPGCESWWTMQRFWRAGGGWGWYRHQPTFSSNHIHGGCVPVPNGGSVADDFDTRVGIYVPGQLVDYYNHAFGLVGGHTPGSDGSWFPPSISKTIFDLRAYALRQEAAMPLNEHDMNRIENVVKSKLDAALKDLVPEIVKATLSAEFTGKDGKPITVRRALRAAAATPALIKELEALPPEDSP